MRCFLNKQGFAAHTCRNSFCGLIWLSSEFATFQLRPSFPSESSVPPLLCVAGYVSNGIRRPSVEQDMLFGYYLVQELPVKACSEIRMPAESASGDHPASVKFYAAQFF